MWLKALAVKNYGPFVNQTVFSFKPGVSVVYGLNKTSGANSKNSNWVGKSLFFSSLSEILYDEPVVGTKQDRMRSGSRAVILTDGTNTVQIIRKSGKRDSTQIIENNKPIEHLTKTKAQEYISSKWLLNKAEFETFVHIDSRIPHPLVMGSSTERKHFFDSFFKLDRIDQERKLYMQALRKLEASKQAFNELKVFYKQQKAGVVEPSKVKQLVKEIKQLRAEQKANARSFEIVNQYNQLKAVYDSLKNNLQGVDLSAVSTELNALVAKRKTLKELREQCIEYRTYLKAKKQYDSQLSALSDLASSTPLAKLSKGNSLWLKYSEQLQEAQDTVLEVVQKPQKLGSPQDLKALELQQSKLEDLLRTSLKFKSGVCPTCGQPVKVHSVKSIKQELIELQKKINEGQLWEHYEQQKQLYAQYKEQARQRQELITDLEQKTKKFEPYRTAYKERSKLPPEPTVVARPKLTTKQVDQQLHELESRLDQLKAIEPHVEQLQEYLNWSDITTFDYKKHNAQNEKLAHLEALYTMHKASVEQVNKTKQRLKELKAQLADEPWLTKLIEIFSDKQMKKAMVQQISQKLCQLMNKYAALVFNQDYRFELIWDTQLQLLCTRRVGKQVLTSDVRKLSGAESKLFTIILVLSLLSFVPSDKRPKVMILDEPSANFSAETTQAFIKLLDVLKQVVPSIVVITPRDDVYPNSVPYTVVRTKEGSSIVQGLPDQIKV